MAPRKKADEKPKAKRSRSKAESSGAKAKKKTDDRDAKGKFKQGHAGGPGPDTIYTDELGERIQKLLSDGLTVNHIERMEGMPKGSTIRGWALKPEHPFSALYTRGRELGYHKMADDLVDIVDDGRNDWMERTLSQESDDSPAKVAWQINGEAIARSKLRAEKRQWLLSKALPRIYGDKLALTDPDGGALTVRFAR